MIARGALVLAARDHNAVAMATPLIFYANRAAALGFGAADTLAAYESAHGIRRPDWSAWYH